MQAFAQVDSSDESSDDNQEYQHPSTDPRLDDAFADYNPRKRRRTDKSSEQRKESAALGVFGSESEDEGFRGGWKKKTLRGRGVGFVSTGARKRDDDDEDTEPEEDGKWDDNQVAEEEENEKDVAMDDDAPVQRGLGFGTAKQRGHAPAGIGNPLGRGFVPSSAMDPILRVEDAEETPVARTVFRSAFDSSNRKKGQNAGEGSGAAAGSFAARMMAKMGYKEGQGLGRDGQGRSGVIEVTLRPQGAGLGAVKEKSKQEREEEKRQARLRGETVADSDEERKNTKRKIKSGTSSTGLGTPKRPTPKTRYQTVDEVRKAAPGLHIPDAFKPILDMTGPAQRLLTTTSGLLTPTTAGETKPMSIEQVESRKLARRAQHDLTAFVEEWKNLQERKAYVEMEIIQHRQETEAFEEEHKRLAKFAGIVDGLSSSSENGQWDPVLQALLAAESLGAAPTANEDLSNIAVAAVYPFLRQRVEGWQPLEDPKLGDMATLLYSIRHILGAGADQQALAKTQVRRNRHRTTAYESMIYKVIFPKVVSAIHGWDAHNPTPLLTFFDAWKDLLPPFVRSQILDQAIVNKLHAAVSAWNPRKRRSYELPHLWLFPWLPYLSPYHVDPSSSSGLVGDVKRKFRHLIDAWDYAKGVIPGLSQWREILQPRRGRDYWTPLIMGHVLPGMSRFLKSTRHFQVDPNDQAPYMPALQGILAWSEHGILTPRALGQVLVETIFPMWHDVLHQWLTVVGPNEEIGQWFEWWRDQVFPENIKNLAPIQAEFQRGHEMIIHALDLGADVASMLPAPTSTETIATTPDKPSPTPQHIAVPAMPEEISFRQQIEDWCIDNDLQFLPEKRVLHAAGPLYRITAAANGKLGVLVYFRGDEIWAVQRAGRQGESTSDQDVLVHWASEEGRDVLLGMAWLGVK